MTVKRSDTLLQTTTADEFKQELPAFWHPHRVGDMSAFDLYRNDLGISYHFRAVSSSTERASVEADLGERGYRDDLVLKDGQWEVQPRRASFYRQNIPEEWKSKLQHKTVKSSNLSQNTVESSNLPRDAWELVEVDTTADGDGEDPWQIVFPDHSSKGSL